MSTPDFLTCRTSTVLILSLLAAMAGCSSSDDSTTNPSNGHQNSGGSGVEATGGANGGATEAAGGSPGGGSVGTGGSETGTGGNETGTGGNVVGTGGSVVGTGGGTTGTGGSESGTGGQAGGTGGTTTTDPEATSGCGAPPPQDACSDTPCTLNGLEYFVDIPDDYDPDHPYPVVFQYHPLGGTAQGARTMYRVRPNFPDAIYVSPEGSDNGFPNTGGVDEDMTRDIIADIESKFCIDRARYFATGFSYGGSMSYTAGFCIADIFRAIAPMAGATISGANSCDPERPMAAWINHGSEDTALPISMSITLRDRLVEQNGCSEETVPVDPSPCVAYQGCDEGYPVIWCEQEGVGHAIPQYGSTAIADFFQQF